MGRTHFGATFFALAALAAERRAHWHVNIAIHGVVRSEPSLHCGRQSYHWHTTKMIAYVDGGARGHPGSAGIGIVIEHPTGRRVEISQCIGGCDNNYAEYAALLVALEYAVACDSPVLQVYSDSEVVVRQVSGAYTCQSPVLLDIYKACKALIASFQQFAITHIRRENNAHADRLAKQAIDRATREHQVVTEDSFLGSARKLVPLEQGG
jgi:ribonuclease HI